jgi:hypothetical protein
VSSSSEPKLGESTYAGVVSADSDVLSMKNLLMAAMPYVFENCVLYLWYFHSWVVLVLTSTTSQQRTSKLGDVGLGRGN